MESIRRSYERCASSNHVIAWMWSARKARVEVNCGHLCKPEAKSGRRVETFPRLSGINLPARSTLNIYVTAPQMIGVLIQYHVLAGNFTKVTSCLQPGSRKPHRSCH